MANKTTANRLIRTYFLPSEFAPSDVADDDCVVVDILRATTTMSHALQNGAAKIVPCLTIEDAMAVKASSQGALLGGERGGIKIDGFDLSNSPHDYTTDTVSGRTLAFTTTNGTKALHQCNEASSVCIGAFVNLTAVVERLSLSNRPLTIVCAGTNGEVTGEDVLFAGALVSKVAEERDVELSDTSRIAQSFWVSSCPDSTNEQVEQAMRSAFGGRNLIKLGYDRDIQTASLIDSVPVYAAYEDGSVKLAEG